MYKCILHIHIPTYVYIYTYLVFICGVFLDDWQGTPGVGKTLHSHKEDGFGMTFPENPIASIIYISSPEVVIFVAFLDTNMLHRILSLQSFYCCCLTWLNTNLFFLLICRDHCGTTTLLFGCVVPPRVHAFRMVSPQTNDQSDSSKHASI